MHAYWETSCLASRLSQIGLPDGHNYLFGRLQCHADQRILSRRAGDGGKSVRSNANCVGIDEQTSQRSTTEVRKPFLLMTRPSLLSPVRRIISRPLSASRFCSPRAHNVREADAAPARRQLPKRFVNGFPGPSGAAGPQWESACYQWQCR